MKTDGLGANDRPLRVLHISTTISRGGAENHLADLIEGQVAKGLEIGCAYLKGDPYWGSRLSALGVEITDLRMKYNGAPGPLSRLRHLIKRFRPDFVHAHGLHAEFYTYAATRLMLQPPPMLISRHEERIRFFRIPGFAIFDRLLTSAAARFIAISNAIKNIDVRRNPAINRKMDVIHYGFDAGREQTHQLRQRAEALRTEWRVPSRGVLLVTLARLAEEKSIDTLLRGFAEFLRLQPGSEARLAIVGRGPLEMDLRSLAAELSIDDKVTWAGFRDDVPTVLEACDIFVLPSIYEGFGLVLLEAMAAARPIVATRTSAIPEIVSEPETGLLFPPKHWKALAIHISTLAKDARLRKRMGRAGRRRLEEHFPVARMVDRTVRFYHAAKRT